MPQRKARIGKGIPKKGIYPIERYAIIKIRSKKVLQKAERELDERFSGLRKTSESIIVTFSGSHCPYSRGNKSSLDTSTPFSHK